ncbi:MAG: MFS transporter [Anaerolineae bacterium]|nr:MFS transporter [Anaerolineae bacterium]
MIKVLAFASEKLRVRQRAKLPAVQSANFWHLYWDIAWFGVAFGSTMSFLPVFATRLGATGWQIGLLNALPALVSVLFTFPASRWIEGRPLNRVLKQTVIGQRVGFILLMPLPFILPAAWQIWAVLLLTLLMAIPGTALVIGFNAMLAATVAPEFRGRVVGGRNALLAGAIMLSFLLSGAILDRLTFTWGYFVVFGLGALGAALSAYHVMCIQIPDTPPQFQGRSLRDRAQPGRIVAFSGGVPQRLSIGSRLLLHWRPSMGSFRYISSEFWWTMFAFFLFHLAQLLPTPLFPLFWVREAHLTDGQISWVNAVFFLTMLIASPLLAPLTKRLGNYYLTVIGAILLSAYPLFTALSQGLTLLIVAGLTGGAVWAILSGALYNRLLEIIPEDNRPAHLAVYNLALNVATLLGTMAAPFLADFIGLREMLFVVTILRLGSGLALARWG